MEAIKNWLQDWSDACVYARECAPDFGAFPIPSGEPYTALGVIAGLCFMTWAINERRLANRTAVSRAAPQTTIARNRPSLIGKAGQNVPA
jgi:hypothetical protein